MSNFLTIRYVDYVEVAREKTFKNGVFVKGLKKKTINTAEIKEFADNPFASLAAEKKSFFQPYENAELPFGPSDVQSRIHTKDGKFYDVLEHDLFILKRSPS